MHFWGYLAEQKGYRRLLWIIVVNSYNNNMLCHQFSRACGTSFIDSEKYRIVPYKYTKQDRLMTHDETPIKMSATFQSDIFDHVPKFVKWRTKTTAYNQYDNQKYIFFIKSSIISKNKSLISGFGTKFTHPDPIRMHRTCKMVIDRARAHHNIRIYERTYVCMLYRTTILRFAYIRTICSWIDLQFYCKLKSNEVGHERAQWMRVHNIHHVARAMRPACGTRCNRDDAALEMRLCKPFASKRMRAAHMKHNSIWANARSHIMFVRLDSWYVRKNCRFASALLGHDCIQSSAARGTSVQTPDR